MSVNGVQRLNWGCGADPQPGWLNSDVKEGAGIDLPCDILVGLPLESDSIDYAVSIHALPEIAYPDIVTVLEELRRVIKPGGVLRLGLPDIERGFAALQRGDPDYFLIPDEDAESVGAKFVVQMIWYGYSRTIFTYDFIAEQLRRAGFSQVWRCAFRSTVSTHPEIVELDNREAESLFLEAVK